MNAINLWQAISGFDADQLGWQLYCHHLSGKYSLQLTQALAHFIWQGCALAAVYALAAVFMRRTSANARYLAGVATLLAMAVCLPATLWWIAAPEMPSENVKMTAPPAATRPLDDVPVVHVVRSDSPKSEDKWSFLPDRLAALLARMSPYASGFYLFGVIMMFLRVAMGLWGGRRLCRSGAPVENGPLFDAMRDCARRMGMRVVPAVAYCGRISVPVVLGIWRPMILLPASLAVGLTPEQFQTLLLHELAHIRRFDPAVNVLQRVVEAMLFFHPAVWWISRQVGLERENACDDAVLHLDHQRIQYADALLRLAELCTEGGTECGALAATGGNHSQFRRRILRLLGVAEKPPVQPTTAGVLTSVLMAATILFSPMIWQSTINAQVESPPKISAGAKKEPANVKDFSPKAEKERCIRVFRLRYTRVADVKAMIEPLLSKGASITTNSDADGQVIIVKDCEPVLKAVERIVKEIDVQPVQVMLEAVLVEVKLMKGRDLDYVLSSLTSKKEATDSNYHPAYNAMSGQKTANATPANGVAQDANGLRIGWISGGVPAFISGLEALSETRIIASPRVFVMNKQRAEFHLGRKSSGHIENMHEVSSAMAEDALDREWKLRVRPFVAADGMIRLETHLEYSMIESLKSDNSQSYTSQSTTNVMVPDGKTFVIGGQLGGSSVRGKIKAASAIEKNVAQKAILVVLTPCLWKPEGQELSENIQPGKTTGIAPRHANAAIARPLLTEVKFIGCKNIRKNTLQKEANIKEGDPIDPLVIEKARRKIEEYYHAKGFADARVGLLAGNRPDDRRAIFLIQEKAGAKTYDVLFVGNTIVSDNRLKTLIDSKHPSLFLIGGEIIRSKLDEVEKRLAVYYRGLGFLKVQVRCILEFDEEKDRIPVRFIIDEGPRYRVHNVNFILNRNFEFGIEPLAAVLKLKTNDYFNQAKLDADVKALREKCVALGAASADVKADIRLLAETGQFDLFYEIVDKNRQSESRSQKTLSTNREIFSVTL
jgi:beta-lactamase regulating signal transducer with metallopeptidase domain